MEFSTIFSFQWGSWTSIFSTKPRRIQGSGVEGGTHCELYRVCVSGFFFGVVYQNHLTVIENIDKKYVAFHFGWVDQLGFLHKNGMLRSINIEIITCGNVHQTWWWLQISHLTSAWITRPHIVSRHWNDCVNLLGCIGESSAKFAVW